MTSCTECVPSVPWGPSMALGDKSGRYSVLWVHLSTHLRERGEGVKEDRPANPTPTPDFHIEAVALLYVTSADVLLSLFTAPFAWNSPHFALLAFLTKESDVGEGHDER